VTDKLSDGRRRRTGQQNRALHKCNCGCGQYLTTEERFWEKVAKIGEDECWNWLAGKDKDGYGFFTIKRTKVRAHRYSYELCVAEIAPELVIDHICRNPSCVNPSHLRPMTNAENILIGNGFAAMNARKTHCINGHELNGDNLYTHKKTGKRYCKICDKARHKECYERKKTKNA